MEAECHESPSNGAEWSSDSASSPSVLTVRLCDPSVELMYDGRTEGEGKGVPKDSRGNGASTAALLAPELLAGRPPNTLSSPRPADCSNPTIYLSRSGMSDHHATIRHGCWFSARDDRFVKIPMRTFRPSARRYLMARFTSAIAWTLLGQLWQQLAAL